MNTPIYNCLINKKTTNTPIWFMRQAGRYLPEFRKIRRSNSNFIKLTLNYKLSSKITLQPLERFNLSAAIIFSDILLVPYGLGQKVVFKKKIGPQLGILDLEKIYKNNESTFSKNLFPVYKTINNVKQNSLLKNKDLIGFVGAPWTLLVYMINQSSPKNKLVKNFFADETLINQTLKCLEKYLKIHIKNQIKNGATIIQIFDSWAGLVEKKNLDKYLYSPTLNLVNYVKSFKIPVICFPRDIKDYKKFSEIVKPNAINIDYNIDPKLAVKQIKIPIQGGLNPNILLSDKINLKKNALNYLNIFKNHPYIFNLGHGILPKTNPMMIDYLVKLVEDY